MFSLTSTLHKPLTNKPPFERIKEHTLGKRYDLSLVLCGDTKARRLNQTYRNKSYNPNVLSFPIDTSSGEIYINVRQAEREAKKYGHTFKKHLSYLLIHGMLHLKGMAHGSRMEHEENAILSHFGL